MSRAFFTDRAPPNTGWTRARNQKAGRASALAARGTLAVAGGAPPVPPSCGGGGVGSPQGGRGCETVVDAGGRDQTCGGGPKDLIFREMQTGNPMIQNAIRNDKKDIFWKRDNHRKSLAPAIHHPPKLVFLCRSPAHAVRREQPDLATLPQAATIKRTLTRWHKHGGG